MQTGMFTTHADAYAMGITMLVCLTGKGAQEAMGTCAEMLEDASAATAHVDPAAEWPSGGSARTLTRLVEVVQGLVNGGLRRRTPFAEAVSMLEELAEDANLRCGRDGTAPARTTARPCRRWRS